MTDRRRTVLALAGLLLVAWGARVAYDLLADPVPVMQGITRKNEAAADHLLAGSGFMLQTTPGAEVPYVDRFPAWIVITALLRFLLGDDRLPLVIGHAFLGSLQAPLIVLLGRRLFDDGRLAWTAGFGVALFPPFWRSDVQLLETGTCSAVVAACALAAARFADDPTWRRAIVLAAVTSLAIALRPDYLFVALVACLALVPWLPRARWPRLLPALLLPLTFLVPWGVRNAQVADGFFISAGLGNNLLQGFGEAVRGDDAPYGDTKIAAEEGRSGLYWPDPKARDTARRDRALELIREHPGTYVVSCVRRVPVLLSLHAGELWPGGRTLRDHVRTWRLENPDAARYEGLIRAALSYVATHPVRAVLTLAWGPILLVSAAIGCVLLRRRRRELVLLLALPAYGFFVHLPLHAEPRYFIPFAGLLFLPAAAAWTAWPRRTPSDEPADEPADGATDGASDEPT